MASGKGSEPASSTELHITHETGNMYTRIPPTSIRLLEISSQAVSCLGIETVACQMMLVESSNAPPYTALSYTWGSDKKTRPILLNNKLTAITKNLYLALKHIRASHSYRTLWCDGLCINQNDPIEKAKQVQNMRFVYEGAETDLMFLGSASDDSDEATGAFDVHGRHLRETYPSPRTKRSSRTT
jgi:hypothetical protein